MKNLKLDQFSQILLPLSPSPCAKVQIWPAQNLFMHGGFLWHYSQDYSQKGFTKAAGPFQQGQFQGKKIGNGKVWFDANAFQVLKHLSNLPDLTFGNFFFFSKAKECLANSITAATAVLKMLEGVSKTTCKQSFATPKRQQFEWCYVKWRWQACLN